MSLIIVNIFIIIIFCCLFFCSASLLFLSNSNKVTKWAKIIDTKCLGSNKQLCELSIRYNIEEIIIDNKLIGNFSNVLKPNDFILIDYDPNNYLNISLHYSTNSYSVILILMGLFGLLICTILYDHMYKNIDGKIHEYLGIFDFMLGKKN